MLFNTKLCGSTPDCQGCPSGHRFPGICQRVLKLRKDWLNTPSDLIVLLLTVKLSSCVTMSPRKAVVIEPVEHAQVQDVPLPAPGPGQKVVKTVAVGLNFQIGSSLAKLCA
jgi:hypothetical protein